MQRPPTQDLLDLSHEWDGVIIEKSVTSRTRKQTTW